MARQLYSTKYLNAEIRDEERTLHIRHVKHRIGPFFLTKIGQVHYLFKINDEIYETKESMTKNIKVITYSTEHYLPLNNTCKLLEQSLDANGLDRVDGMMSKIFGELARREKRKEEFTAHDLEKMIKDVSNYEHSKISKIIPKDEQVYLAKKKMILNYLHNLDKKQIVTPLREISHYIDDDLKKTDPQFLASIALTFGLIDYENKKVTNQPIKKSREFIKYILFGILAIMVIGVLMYAYQNNWFDTLSTIGEGFTGIPNPYGGLAPPNQKTDQYYQENYTPEGLKAEVCAGSINENTLPEKTKLMVQGMDCPSTGTDFQVGG